ncbi:MAG: response regulator [Candidatus Absconditabacterales bacterium]|jgi:DNA-binding NtrC family response regulator
MNNKPKILLIDDDEAILDSYSLLWKKRFFLITANDLASALLTVKSESFDLLITDKNLGYHRGIDPLLNYMKEEKPNIPVILLSGEDGNRARQELYCHAFVQKGSLGCSDKLEKTIHELLSV